MKCEKVFSVCLKYIFHNAEKASFPDFDKYVFSRPKTIFYGYGNQGQPGTAPKKRHPKSIGQSLLTEL
jgi:hypothetical protein